MPVATQTWPSGWPGRKTTRAEKRNCSKIAGNNVIERLFAERMPAPFMSVLMDDCIEKGKDYHNGGPRYNPTYIQGVGIGTLLNMRLSPALLEGDGIHRLADLVRSYFRMDGHHVQFNVFDAATLREAQEKPEEYGHLIVRVAGYSDYFVDVGRDLQEEIISRTEHGSF